MIIAGIIIGFVGKFVAPGSRDNTPMWLTIFCGIGGVFDRLVYLQRFWRQCQPWNRLGALAHCNCGGSSSCRHRFYPDRPRHPWVWRRLTAAKDRARLTLKSQVKRARSSLISFAVADPTRRRGCAARSPRRWRMPGPSVPRPGRPSPVMGRRRRRRRDRAGTRSSRPIPRRGCCL